MLCGLLSAENNPGPGVPFLTRTVLKGCENGSQGQRERFSSILAFFDSSFLCKPHDAPKPLLAPFNSLFTLLNRCLFSFAPSVVVSRFLPRSALLSIDLSPPQTLYPLSVVVSHFLLRFALLSFSCCFPISLLVKTVVFLCCF